MSDDGRFVVFGSNAEDVTSDDLDGRYDVFVHDRLTPTQVRRGPGPPPPTLARVRRSGTRWS